MKMAVMPYRMTCLLAALMLAGVGCTAPDRDEPRPLTPLAQRLAKYGPVMYRGDASRSGVLDVPTRRPKTLKRLSDAIYTQAPLVLGDWIITSENNELGLFSVKEKLFRWTKEIGRGSSPAFAEGTIYVNTLEGNVFALDAGDGTTTWKKATDGSFEKRKARLTQEALSRLYSGVFPIPSPAVQAGRVYVANYEGDVLALDQQTGDVAWEYSVGQPVHASVAIHAHRVFIATSKGVVVALDATTGEPVWTQKVSPKPLGTPVAVSGRVFVAVPRVEVVALNARTGRAIWTKPLKHNYTTLASDGARVFMTSGGGVNSVDAKTGSLDWRWEMKPSCYLCVLPSPAQGLIFGPTVGRDAVYVASVNEGLRAIDRDSGTLLWRFVIPRVGGVSEPVIGTDSILIYGVANAGRYLAVLR